MGACVSTCREWKSAAETDEEVTGQPLPGQGKAHGMALPSGAPEGYVLPPVAVPVHAMPAAAHGVQLGGGLHDEAAGAAAAGGGKGRLKHIPSEQLFFFRASQEQGMAHLVRHPRLQPFAQQGGQFGLASAYEPLKLLGRGGTGQTWLCRERETGRMYALKLQQRPLPRNTVRLAYNEITITASTGVSSVHATHIKEAILTPSHLALVLDYEAGGSLAEFVANRIPQVSRHDLILDEQHARFMFRQLLLGLQHLHENHVAHRDVKLDNTLLDGEPLPTVKLCDLQFAKYWGPPQLTRTKTHLGTAVYMAPELIEQRSTHAAYDPVEVDVWAAGIWLLALLAGAFAFDNRPSADDTAAEVQILQQERKGPWSESRFIRNYVHLLSPELIDLLNQTLHVDPQQRIDLEGLATHPWVLKPLPPHLEEAWQRVRRAQLALEHRLAALQPDHDLVQQRNSRVYDMVREAAAPVESWRESYQRIAQMCERSGLVDCSSIEGALRIDMQPEAVAKRISERALALLDTTPPGTPHRFSLPLQHIPSETSLPNLAGASGASPAGSAAGGGSEAAASSSTAAASGQHGAERLTQLSPFASATTR